MSLEEGKIVKQKLKIQKKSQRDKANSEVKKELQGLHCQTYRLENLTDFMRNMIYN
ncbi:hypothetical protein HOF92_03760 [bacterium]|nr:hypothetical protein [bacterium]